MQNENYYSEFYRLENIELDDIKKEQLNSFFEILIQENIKYNLTTITEEKDVYIKHFFDSLIFSNKIKLTNERICDIGTGAGFPGIIIKIFFPETNITLVESNSKKVYFLNLVIEKLNLKNINVICDRVENLSDSLRESFEIVISRAMAALNILLEVGSQMPKVNGYFICLKSKNLSNELDELKNGYKLLGYEIENIQEIDFDFLGQRSNIFLKKINQTPSKYPRNYSQIKKKPLGN